MSREISQTVLAFCDNLRELLTRPQTSEETQESSVFETIKAKFRQCPYEDINESFVQNLCESGFTLKVAEYTHTFGTGENSKILKFSGSFAEPETEVICMFTANSADTTRHTFVLPLKNSGPESFAKILAQAISGL